VAPNIHELVSRLAEPASRASEAVNIAAEVGAEALLILLHDEAIGALTPAPGFPQTLPGGPTWRAFLKDQHSLGAMETELPFPSSDELKLARVFVERDTVFMLIGGDPSFDVREFVDAPLLAALLRAEAEQLRSIGLVSAAREASARATNLAASLDAAKAEVRRKADELALTLSRSDHLNEQLKRLNETLEQRVSDEIRERLQAEDALRQAQKMEAVGQLTGGVAHDFNNLLTVIMGGLDSIKREIDKESDIDVRRLRRMQALAFQAADRAATLTSRLLAFARRQPLAPKPINLNKLVSGVSDLLQRTLGETVAFETVMAAGLWLAHADPTELESALMNLAINARDAMPNGGKLTIETANVSLDENYVSRLVEPVPAGQYAMLAVSDTGEGMDKETVDRVFEPFFTTKKAGKGTGLGLSQVYGFVRQSGGFVSVTSEVGQGTTIDLCLPYTDEVAVAAPVTQAPTATGDGRVLVVDDDINVREVSVAMLGALGYSTVEAGDAVEALGVLAAREDIDVVFSDVIMPGEINGLDLARHVRENYPGVAVVLASGYTAQQHGDKGAPSDVELLHKPYSRAALAAALARARTGANGSL